MRDLANYLIARVVKSERSSKECGSKFVLNCTVLQKRSSETLTICTPLLPNVQLRGVARLCVLCGWAAAVILFRSAVTMVVVDETLSPAKDWRRFFGMGGENNLPTLFTVCLMVVCASLLAKCALQSGLALRKYWFALAVGFLLMAIDEWFMFHERLLEPSAWLLVTLGMRPGHLGLLAYAWVVPALFLVAVLGLFFLPFLQLVGHPLNRRLVSAGLVYLAGAIGMEMVGGWHAETFGETGKLITALLAHLEEALEIAGLMLLIQVLLTSCFGSGAAADLETRAH